MYTGVVTEGLEIDWYMKILELADDQRMVNVQFEIICKHILPLLTPENAIDVVKFTTTRKWISDAKKVHSALLDHCVAVISKNLFELYQNKKNEVLGIK